MTFSNSIKVVQYKITKKFNYGNTRFVTRLAFTSRLGPIQDTRSRKVAWSCDPSSSSLWRSCWPRRRVRYPPLSLPKRVSSTCFDDRCVDAPETVVVKLSAIAPVVQSFSSSRASFFLSLFFVTQFTAYATEITDISNQEALNMQQAVQALGASITSAALSAGDNFPNVTVPDFEVHGVNNNQISKVLQVTYAPLIERKGRERWETYAASHQEEWFEASTSRPDTHQRYLKAVDKGTKIASESLPLPIHGWEDNRTGALAKVSPIEVGQWDYAPVWQQAPAPHQDDASIINFDVFSHPDLARLFHGVWETEQAVLSQAMPLDFLYGGAVQDEISHPHSILMNPIYRSLKPDRRGKGEMVGLMLAVVSWDKYLSNILHEGNDGVVVVLDNTCGEHFTYRIDGPNAIFLGSGDLHDAQYNELEFRRPFARSLDNHTSKREHCEFDLRIYPTTTLKNRYTSLGPVWYAFAIIVIFSFTALTFLLFDYTVALRQRKVVAKAKRTHAIVSALFPSHVRDQLLHEAEEAEEQNRRQRMPFLSSADHQSRDYPGKPHDGPGFGSKPIAELYPSATVMVRSQLGLCMPAV
jgi:CHASE domain